MYRRLLYFALYMFVISSGSTLLASDGLPDVRGARTAKISLELSPVEYCIRLKQKSYTQVPISDEVKIIWPFRLISGVNRQFLSDYAMTHQLQLDNSFFGKIKALRLYAAYGTNYDFYHSTVPNVFLCSNVVFNFLSVLLTSLPLRVPDGIQQVYLVLNQKFCGGEFSVCPSEKLVRTLPAGIVNEFYDGQVGISIYFMFICLEPLASKLIHSELSSVEQIRPYRFSSACLTVYHGQRHLEERDRAYTNMKPYAIAHMMVMSAVSVIGINALYKAMSGTVATDLTQVTFADFLNRGVRQACAIAVDRITSFPCDTTIPIEYILASEIYYAGTKVMVATVVDTFPFMLPVYVLMFKYLLFCLRLL